MPSPLRLSLNLLKVIEEADPKALANELRTLEKRCNLQRDYNAELLSKMVHLQGNIQVYCRVRAGDDDGSDTAAVGTGDGVPTVLPTMCSCRRRQRTDVTG